LVALTFDPLYYSFLVLLSAIVPGIAVGWPLLRKSELSVVEKLLLCFFVGLVAPPTLLIVENIAGLKFSLSLVLMNIFALSAAGISYGMRNGAFSLQLLQFDLDAAFSLEFAEKHAASFLLLLAVFLAFWLRIQTFSPIYSELDPYFYVYGTGQIIRFGEVPPTDDTAWWPEIKNAGHRNFPSLKMYLEAQWYALYTKGAEYNNYLLFVTSSWLPPIAGALLAFGAYLLFASYYGKRYGLLAAFLMAFLPITIYKMSAGVNEAAPFGMMSVFLTMGVYALALKKKDYALGALAALIFFSSVAGSNYEAVTALVFSGFVVLQGLGYFLCNQRNRDFLAVSGMAAAGLLLGTAVDVAYGSGIGHIGGMISGQTVLVLLALCFAFALDYLAGRASLSLKKKWALVVAGVFFALLVLIAPNPAGSAIREQIKGYVGVADFKFPLERTIAEQNQAGANFEGEGGFLALVPRSHIAEQAAGIDLLWNEAYNGLDLISTPFTYLGNGLMSGADMLFNSLAGTTIQSGLKDDSLLFVFLSLSTACLLIRHFAGQKAEQPEPSIAILLLLLMLPVSYVGLNKIKYTLFVGLSAVVAAVATLGEMERLLGGVVSRMKSQSAGTYVRWLFSAMAILLILAEFSVPFPLAGMILKKSLEPRYQDNPVAMMPKLAKTCEELRSVGYYDPEICAAGYNASFADSINNQFNSKVCLVSQLSLSEMVPKSDAEKAASSEARFGASFRCNRIADYWIDSMEWIRNNLNESDRVTSWWDYGHWINYFGDRKSVLRNEHVSKGMIGRVAHDYIDGTPQDLADSMNYFDSRYVLFDVELIGGGSFGGKYGALNYLSCAHDNLTSVLRAPGTSQCEYEHSPERLVIPNFQSQATTCVISESQQTTGVYAYRATLPGMEPTPAYCVGGELTLSTGEKITPMYYADKRDQNGDLVLNRGFLRQVERGEQASLYEVVYNDAPVWPDGKGGYTSGLEDAKTKFYTSNLYRGFYLKSLPGFELVYQSKNGEVKIYRLQNFTGNKEGYVDPASAAKTQ